VSFAWKTGERLPELRVTPERYTTIRYAGASGDFNPIHIDDELARSVGLPGRILHGLYTMALVARAHTEAAGDPAALRRLSVQFRAPGVPERELAVESVVSEVDEDRLVTEVDEDRLVTDVTVEQDGKAIVRRAQAELRRAKAH
jgi:acyl dehydratase